MIVVCSVCNVLMSVDVNGGCVVMFVVLSWFLRIGSVIEVGLMMCVDIIDNVLCSVVFVCVVCGDVFNIVIGLYMMVLYFMI